MSGYNQFGGASGLRRKAYGIRDSHSHRLEGNILGIRIIHFNSQSSHTINKFNVKNYGAGTQVRSIYCAITAIRRCFKSRNRDLEGAVIGCQYTSVWGRCRNRYNIITTGCRCCRCRRYFDVTGVNTCRITAGCSVKILGINTKIIVFKDLEPVGCI